MVRVLLGIFRRRCFSFSYGIFMVFSCYFSILFWFSKNKEVILNRSGVSRERELMKNVVILKMLGCI